MPTHSLARLIERAQTGDRLALNAFYDASFHRLRSIAASLLQRERAGHSLQPTALVSELFLKLYRVQMRILSDDHFYGVSARAMKQVLIDHARTKGARKRAAPEFVADLLASERNGADPDMVLAVREALEKLREVDPVAAATIWLRCVEGRSIEEVSRVQNRKQWRVRADFDFGIQWMAGRLGGYPRPGSC